MTITVLRKKGQITIPSKIRNEIGLGEEDLVTMFSWNKKAMIMIPKQLKTVDLLKESASLARKKGITLEELLVELDEIRHKA